MKLLPLKSQRCFDRMRIVMMMLVLICLCGCMADEDEDHHLEHLIPAHKPADFSVCVEQLEIRGGKFFSETLTESEMTELRDIINWLPELAADSDLKRQQWEQVQGIATELEKLAQESPSPDTDKLWSQHVAALEELIPFADSFKSGKEVSAQHQAGSDEEKNND